MKKIELTNVYKSFNKKIVLKNVSFTAEEGEFLSLLGPSGSGKSTLLKIIAGIHQPDSGDILMDGASILKTPIEKRGTIIVFQDHLLFPHLNLEDNIGFGLKMAGIKKYARKEKVKNIINLLKLEGSEKKYPEELSGGQKQRAALGRAIAVEPGILLLDEPFSSLDTVVRMKLKKELRNIQKELDIPVIFITHDPVEAFTLSDKMVVFDNGKIEQAGFPEDIFYHPKTQYVAELVGFSNLFDDAVVEGHGQKAECTFLWSLGTEITAPYIRRLAGEKVSWGVRPENVELVKYENINEVEKEAHKNLLEGSIKNIVNKGTSRIMALKLKESGAYLNVEVTNQIFDSLKIDTEDEYLVRIKPSDMIVF